MMPLALELHQHICFILIQDNILLGTAIFNKAIDIIWRMQISWTVKKHIYIIDLVFMDFTQLKLTANTYIFFYLKVILLLFFQNSSR